MFYLYIMNIMLFLIILYCHITGKNVYHHKLFSYQLLFKNTFDSVFQRDAKKSQLLRIIWILFSKKNVYSNTCIYKYNFYYYLLITWISYIKFPQIVTKSEGSSRSGSSLLPNGKLYYYYNILCTVFKLSRNITYLYMYII